MNVYSKISVGRCDRIKIRAKCNSDYTVTQVYICAEKSPQACRNRCYKLIYRITCYATRNNNSTRRINKLPREFFYSWVTWYMRLCDYTISTARSMLYLKLLRSEIIFAWITHIINNSRIMQRPDDRFMRRHTYVRRETTYNHGKNAKTISRFVSRLVYRRALLVQSSSSDEASENCRESAKGDFNSGSLVKMRILDLT